MGIDACIYVKTSDGQEPQLCDPLPNDCRVCPVDPRYQGYECEGATHEIDQHWRYYSPGYERGPWPSIAAVLLALHASPNVETVWYFGDCSDGDQPFTPERVQEISAHYMKEGDRPYRGPRPAAKVLPNPPPA